MRSDDTIDRVLAKLRSDAKVLGAFHMKQGIRLRVEVEESRISSVCGVEYENRSLLDDRHKDIHICVFSTSFLNDPTECQVVLTDETGIIYGHDVPRGMPRS